MTRRAGQSALTTRTAREIGLSLVPCDGVDAFLAKLEKQAPGPKMREVGKAALFGRMGQAQELTGKAIIAASEGAEHALPKPTTMMVAFG